MVKLRRKLRPTVASKPNRITTPDWLGARKPEILFVVDPIVGREGEADAPDAALPIDKRAMMFLTNACQEYGIPLNKCAITRACPPVTAEQNASDKKLGDIIKEYHQTFADNVSRGKPKLIVALGKASARQVYNRPIKIMSVRGMPEQNAEFNCNVFPMLGLSHVMFRPEVRNIFNSDLETLQKMIDSDYSLQYQTESKNDYRWCTDLSDLLERADAGEKLELAVDIEGVGLRWYEPHTKILTVQITEKAGEGRACPIDYNHLDNTEPHDKAAPPSPKQRARIVSQLKRLLEHPNVGCFGHNFKFDYIMMLKKLGIQVKNWIDDTICLLHAIDENIPSKSLADGTRLYVPEMSGYSDKFDRDPIHEKKSRMDKVGPAKMLAYGCGDTDATFRLRDNLLTMLKTDRMAYGCYRKVVIPALEAFGKIEDHGFTVDRRELKKFEIMLRAHQKSEYARILEMIPDSIKQEQLGPDFQKRIKGSKERLPASLTRPGFLRAMLFDHPDGLELTPRVFTKGSRKNLDESTRIPSTSAKEHLAYFLNDHPFIAAIMEYTKSEKLLGTYVGTDADNDNLKGFYRYIFDGRIRPTYLLHRTVTGRSASADPNGQNFPKRGKLAKQYRRVFRAPKGFVYLEVDFSQLELRVAAILANDPTMLDLYRRGADIHAATAAATMGITLDEFYKLDKGVRDLKRYQAKAINFGFLYGMGWRKFVTYAKTEYQIDFTEEEAQAIQAAFFRLYSRLKPWHTATREYVQERGFVRSLSGRVRHLPNVSSSDEAIASSAERMAINSPVQGFGSDLGLIALKILVDTVDFSIIRPIGFIHDAIVCLVPEESYKEAAATVKRVMETLPLKKLFGLTLPIPIIAEASVGRTLADVIELKDSDLAPDNVTTFAELERADYEQRVEKAKKDGDPLPPKPWVYLTDAGLKTTLARRYKAPIITKRKFVRTGATNGKASTQTQGRVFKLRKPRQAA